MARLALAVAVSCITAVMPAARADQLESAVAGYSDNDRTNTIISGSGNFSTTKLFGSEGQKTEFSVGYTHRDVKFKDTINNTYLTTEQLDGKDSMQQSTVNLGLDQSISKFTSVGVLGGITEGPLGVTKWAGGRAGQWWREETLQTTVEVRRTEISQVLGEVYDDDRRIIRLPESLAGNNVNFSFMHFTTPELIWRGTYSRTWRSDRPPADGFSTELRYFLTPLQAAVHGSLGHYENVGEVSRITSYGSVVANTASGEWHQRFLDRFILMGGYRWYTENENPLSETITHKTLGSDWLYGSLRWRFGDGPWLADSHEWSIFGGQYKNSEPRHGQLVGVSLKLIL